MSTTTLIDPSCRRRGVTLVEILGVVAILGLLTAITAPRVDLVHFRVDSGMRTVGAALVGARQEAVARQHDVVVSFDTLVGQLVIHYDANNDRKEDADERVRRIPLGDDIVFGRPEGIPARSFGAEAVTFHPINDRPAVVFRRVGTASEGGGLYLTSRRALADERDQFEDSRAIEIVRSTGRVDWYTYSGVWRRAF